MGGSDCNWTRTQNHLVLKRTLNHLAKLAKMAGITQNKQKALFSLWSLNKTVEI